MDMIIYINKDRVIPTELEQADPQSNKKKDQVTES